jgi:two-component system competent response regulator ComA
MIREVKAIVVDDHPLMAYATQQILEQLEGVEVLGIAYSGAQCMEFVELYQPDLVFLDYQLPDQVGTDVVEQINAKYPSTKIVIFTGVDVTALMNPLLELQVSGVISKGTRHEAIKHIVSCILDNYVVLPREALNKINITYNPEALRAELTEDEVVIMTMIVKGATLEQIADTIHTSKRSVDNYQRKIYDKLGVKTRAQAIEKFIQKRGI